MLAISQRTKEIGIRKVLGASVAGIVGLLSLDFLKRWWPWASWRRPPGRRADWFS